MKTVNRFQDETDTTKTDELTIKKIFILATTLLSIRIAGQTNDSLDRQISNTFLFSKKNLVNFEIFGHGLFYSLSYERLLVNDFHYKVSVQGGISVYPYKNQIDIWLPISINYLRTVGLKRKHHIELGVGHVARFDQYYDGTVQDPWQTFLTAKCGYRHQKPNGKWVFKLLFTPFYEYDKRNIKSVVRPTLYNTVHDINPYPSGAISIGRTF